MVQGHSFITTAGVLSLKSFDMVLGADWLDSFSPMWIHWAQKILRFTHHGHRIQLQGIVSDQLQCTSTSPEGIHGLFSKQDVTCCLQLRVGQCWDQMNEVQSEVCLVSSQEATELPADLQDLLGQYDGLFQAPTELPPHRPHDHVIDLLLGAQPVNIRPYKYSLA